jgi:hypothetical protein
MLKDVDDLTGRLIAPLLMSVTEVRTIGRRMIPRGVALMSELHIALGVVMREEAV